MRLFFVLLVMVIALNARENPFFPVDSLEDVPLTSNITKNIPPLERATIELPSTARVLKRVTIEYKNLDGSIAKKTLELSNAIDWHLPIFISQNIGSSPELPKKKKDGKPKYKKLLSLPFISFYADGKFLQIRTSDPMERDFLLVKPHRIVCDFQGDREIGSFIKRVKNAKLFKKIRIGTHSGYYRVVIELDGYYQYKLKKIKGGYLFELL